MRQVPFCMQTTVVAFFLLVMSIVCVRAETMSPQQITDIRGQSLVFLQDENSSPKHKGFGVLVSDSGHVVTARHVIDGFGGAPITGSLGNRDNRIVKLVKLDSFVEDSYDLVLLKFEPEPGVKLDFKPAPIGQADHFKIGTTLRILTSSKDGPEVANHAVEVIASLKKPDFWILQGSGIDIGNSGSPAFDQFGNVVGFVPSGTPKIGRFNLRTFDEKRVQQWLKANNVDYKLRTKPDKIVFYITVGDGLLFDGGGANQYRVTLHQKLAELVDSLSAWKNADDVPFGFTKDFLAPVATALFQKNPPIVFETLFDSNEAEGWVADRVAARLMLYFVDLGITSVGGSTKIQAKQGVLLLTHDGSKVHPSDPRVFKVRPLPPIDAGVSAVASELLKSAILSDDVPLAGNEVVFADCFDVPNSIRNNLTLAGMFQQYLRDELARGWKDNAKFFRYTIYNKQPWMCDNTLGMPDADLEESNKALQDLAQVLIKPMVRPRTDPAEAQAFWQMIRRSPRGSRYSAPPVVLNINQLTNEGYLPKVVAKDISELLEDTLSNARP